MVSSSGAGTYKYSAWEEGGQAAAAVVPLGTALHSRTCRCAKPSRPAHAPAPPL